MQMSTDALWNRLGLLGLVLALTSFGFSEQLVFGATYRTPNFIVTAPTAEIAEKCGKTAEHYRGVLAVEWLGKEMPRWFKPCTLRVKVGQIGAGGATTFAFDRGEVFGWRMNVQGSLERILDSVIPHEVSHTVFASHFRRPLPRWADEGAATLIEHESERRRQSMLLKQVWNSPRRIPLRKLLSIKEYPRDMQDVLTLYAEGYSLADFLVQAGGKTRYLEFLETAHRHGWERAITEHYSLKGVDELNSRWSNWVMAGSPQLNLPKDTQIASQENVPSRAVQNRKAGFERPVIRGQSPEQPSGNASKQSETQPEHRVAVAPAMAKAPQPVALPMTTDIRKESPGWRQMREQLREVPKDFLNPANDPKRTVNATVPRSENGGQRESFTSQSESTETLAVPASPPISNPPVKPPSAEPAFRFELGGT